MGIPDSGRTAVHYTAVGSVHTVAPGQGMDSQVAQRQGTGSHFDPVVEVQVASIAVAAAVRTAAVGLDIHLAQAVVGLDIRLAQVVADPDSLPAQVTAQGSRQCSVVSPAGAAQGKAKTAAVVRRRRQRLNAMQEACARRV